MRIFNETHGLDKRVSVMRCIFYFLSKASFMFNDKNSKNLEYLNTVSNKVEDFKKNKLDFSKILETEDIHTDINIIVRPIINIIYKHILSHDKVVAIQIDTELRIWEPINEFGEYRMVNFKRNSEGGGSINLHNFKTPDELIDYIEQTYVPRDRKISRYTIFSLETCPKTPAELFNVCK